MVIGRCPADCLAHGGFHIGKDAEVTDRAAHVPQHGVQHVAVGVINPAGR